MTKWNKEKLEKMTQQQNPYTTTKLNYLYIAEHYKQINEKLTKNGDLIPLALKDVETAYNGKIAEEIKQPEIDEQTQKKIEEKENKRQVMHIKHFSRSISHQQWYDFLDEELQEFKKKYPEYENIQL